MNLVVHCDADRPASGFTLIELLLIIAIVAIVATSSTPFLSRFLRENHFAMVSDRIKGGIFRAQAAAMTGDSNATWGICQTGTQVKVYAGTCASPTESEMFEIPASVTVTGLSDVTFNDRGEPSAPLSILVSLNSRSRTITLNAAGGLDVAAIAIASPMPSPSPSPLPSPSPTPTASPSPLPSPSPSPSPPSGPLTVSMAFTSEWETGICMEYTITNPTANPVVGWTLTVTKVGYSNYVDWNGNFATSGSTYVITPVGWNTTIPALSSVGSMGHCADKLPGYVAPSIVSIL